MRLIYSHFYTPKYCLYSKPIKNLQGYGIECSFHFNGKEKDNETYGDGNAYDFGARIYSSRLGKWLSVDPLQVEYPSQGSYNYSANNPILYVDRDGRKVFIYGKDAENTACALQKTTSMQLSYDLKTHQLTAIGDPQNDYDRALLSAMNDPNINVNLYVTDKIAYMSKDGSGPMPIMIGGYEGSEVSSAADKDKFLADVASGNLDNLTNENYGQTKIETTQLFNYEQSSAVENAGGEEVGRTAGHEILESYFGADIAPGGDYASSYSQAHQLALNADPIAASSKDGPYKDTSRGFASYQWKIVGKGTVEFSRSSDFKSSNTLQKPQKE